MFRNVDRAFFIGMTCFVSNIGHCLIVTVYKLYTPIFILEAALPKYLKLLTFDLTNHQSCASKILSL